MAVMIIEQIISNKRETQTNLANFLYQGFVANYAVKPYHHQQKDGHEGRQIQPLSLGKTP